MKGQSIQSKQVPGEHMHKHQKRPSLPCKLFCSRKWLGNQVAIVDRELVQRGHQLHPSTLSNITELECKDRNGKNGLPSNNSVFPEPNLPHMRESSPSGKFNDKSTRINLCFGVDAAEGARLLALRSCGQVKVHDRNAMVLDCWSRGGTAITSAPLRYFSIRRRETKL